MSQPNGTAVAAAPSFSYAQAAKGVPSNPASGPSSKVATGTHTPAKDATASPIISPQSNSTPSNLETAAQKPKDSALIPNGSMDHSKAATPQKPQALSNGSPTPPSPAGAYAVESSISTLNREDDSSSLEKALSESGWDKLSQDSLKEENGNGKKSDPTWTKIHHPVEAPLPAVNIWQKRLEAHVVPRANGIPAANTSTPNENSTAIPLHQKQAEGKNGDEEPKARKSGGRKVSGEEKTHLPPSIADQQLWPTVETGVAAEEERKKIDAAKIQKAEKEKSANKTKQWKTIEIDHSAYQSGVPQNNNSRRGGRAANRGGRSSPGGRNGQNDKRHGSPNAGEAKDGRGDSPGKGKDRRESRFNNSRENREQDGEAKVNGKVDENAKHGNNTFPRQKSTRRSDAEPRKDLKVAVDGDTAAAATEDGLGLQQVPTQDSDKRSSIVSESGASRYARGGANGFAARGRGNARGRGGHNFQPPATAPPFQPQHGYGMVRTSSVGHSPFYGQPGNSRMRGNPRGQGMQPDMYGRYWTHAPAVVPPINTYVTQPGMFEYGPQYPMSATTYSPAMEETMKLGYLAFQLRYYFSPENLENDKFLRRNMDSQGFVPLELIAGFHRIRRITGGGEGSFEMLRTVAQVYEDVEYRFGVDGKDRVRHPTLWENYVYKDKTQRDAGAQHDGIEAAPRENWPSRSHNQVITPINPAASPMSAFPYPGPQGFGDFSRISSTEPIDHGRFQSPPTHSQPFMTPNMNGQAFQGPHFGDGHMNGFLPPHGQGPANYSPPKLAAQPNGAPLEHGQPNGLAITTDEQPSIQGTST